MNVAFFYQITGHKADEDPSHRKIILASTEAHSGQRQNQQGQIQMFLSHLAIAKVDQKNPEEAKDQAHQNIGRIMHAQGKAGCAHQEDDRKQIKEDLPIF